METLRIQFLRIQFKWKYLHCLGVGKAEVDARSQLTQVVADQAKILIMAQFYFGYTVIYYNIQMT